MKYISALISLFLFLGMFFQHSPIMASETIAVVIRARGDVKLSHQKQTRKFPVRKSQPLVSGDRLETGPASFCAFRFIDDKSLVRLRANSVCVVEGKKSKKKVDKNIFVQVGTFFASLFRPKGEFKVTTPTSVASVKGTRFWVIQVPGGSTTYICTEGIVEVTNDAGKVLVRAGETGIVASKNSPPQVRLTRQGDLPSEASEEESQQSLELEFQNQSGESKWLKIELEEEQ